MRGADVPRLRLHDLRHTAASVLLAMGVPDNVIAKLGGWRSAAMERYKHLSPDFRAQTVDLLSRVLFTPTSQATPSDRR